MSGRRAAAREPGRRSRRRSCARSASSQQMRSPRHACSDFHSALPLPEPGPASGRTSASATTRAPAARATAAVASVEPSSMTTISSTSAVRPAERELGPYLATMAPIVASSSRAGRHTEIVWPRAARFAVDGDRRDCTGASLRGTLWERRSGRLAIAGRETRAHPERLRDRPCRRRGNQPKSSDRRSDSSQVPMPDR